jgi:hypothetical protein
VEQHKAILDTAVIITDPVELAQYDRLVAMVNRLDNAVLRVDETLMLLEIF